MKENRFVKKITNNIGLKLLAFAIACALWLVVVNYNDPVISYTYSGIPVEIINSDALTAKGKIYEVLNGTDTVSVTITGKRTVVESIGKDNIKAVADIADLTIMDTVEIVVSTNKNFDQLDAIRSDITALELTIEDLAVMNMSVQVDVTGQVADGYIIGDVTSNQNTIKVSGPLSVISSIKGAKLNVDVTGRTSDMATSVDIVLYDEDGLVVEKNNVTTNVKSINVSVAVLPVKAVDIYYSYSGIPEEGYAIDGNLTGTMSAVYVAGKSSVIEGLSAITVPPTAINVDGKNSTFNTTVDLNKYLPDGVRFADSEFDGKVSVTVKIEPTVTRTLNMPLSNVSLINVPDGFTAELYVSSNEISNDDEDVTTDVSEIKVMIVTEGIQSYFDSVTGDDITGIVDVGQYLSSSGNASILEGVYQMEIAVELPDGIRQKDVCYASIKIVAE